jgi:cellulose synthase (UDP-forming)
MMSLQAPALRGEERFEIDEPVSLFAASGALSTGRIRDISLSGVAVVADRTRALATRVGETARIFIAEVGFITARVVRQRETFVALHFELPPSLERDLLIRKLFTAGRDGITENASALSTTGALLMRIWSLGGARQEVEPPEVLEQPAGKLPAESLVILPRVQPERLADIAAERSLAA